MPDADKSTYPRNSSSFIAVGQIPQILWVESLLLTHLDEARAEGEEQAGPDACFLLGAPMACHAMSAHEQIC